MAILVSNNQAETNLSGETLLASNALENSINEARNLSVSIDSKIADLKIKAEEIKTDACDKLDQKEKAFKASINLSTTNAVNNIGKAVKDLEQGSALIKDAWKTTSTIVAHIVLSVIGLALILYLALPTIKQAKDVLSSNQDVLKNPLKSKRKTRSY